MVAFAQGYLFDHEESKEVVQKLFVQLWLNRKSLTINSSLKSYLFSSVKNKCLNHIRDLKIEDRNQLLYIEATLRSHQAQESEKMQQMEKEVWQEIQKLPEQIRKIIILKYYEGKKQKEIASELGISENTVKTQLSRGKTKLSSALQRKLLTLSSFALSIDDILKLISSI